jgi:hypothetical protein
MMTRQHSGVIEQTGELIHDLANELKEEIHDLRTGEQPVEPQADLIVRKHISGLIILLFVLTALILLVGIAVVYLYANH